MGAPYVDGLGYVVDVDATFDAVFVVAEPLTHRPHLVGAAGATRYVRAGAPVLMHGWVVAGRVYGVDARMSEQTLLLADTSRQNRNTLVPIRARDRGKYDSARYLHLDHGTSEPDQSGGQFLTRGLLFDVTERIYNDRR